MITRTTMTAHARRFVPRNYDIFAGLAVDKKSVAIFTPEIDANCCACPRVRSSLSTRTLLFLDSRFRKVSYDDGDVIGPATIIG